MAKRNRTGALGTLRAFGIAALILLFAAPDLLPLSVASGTPWPSYHGIAFRAGSNVWYCVTGSSSCDTPTEASPSTAFSVYRANGFNFARISLDWNYFYQDPTGAANILTQDADACDASGVACYYMWGGSYQFIPGPISAAWSGSVFNSNFAADANIPVVGTPWDGQPAWKAAWNGLFSPAVQILDSHSSTVGYAFENEPNQGWTNSQLEAYYLYMAQQLRTVSSKAFIFQANGGGSGGGGSATIAQLAPAGYGPYVFEIHNYQDVNSYNPYPSVVSQCPYAGWAWVLLGEWGGTSNPTAQQMTDELNAVKQNGMAEEWFSYDGDATTGALKPPLTSLAQVQAQVYGTIASTSTMVTTATSSASTSLTTSIVDTTPSVTTSTPAVTSTTSEKTIETMTSTLAQSTQTGGGGNLSNFEVAALVSAILVIGVVIVLYSRRNG